MQNVVFCEILEKLPSFVCYSPWGA